MTRILVTDVEERSALAVCRGLHAAGWEVTGVAGNRFAAGHWSRSVSRRVTLPNPREDPDLFIEGLVEIAARGEHAALVASVDAATLAVSARRAELEPFLQLGLPPHEVVERCLDKPQVLEAAARVGLPPPASETCATVDEAVAAAERFGYPVLFKPVRSLSRGRVRTMSFAEDEQTLRALFPTYGGEVTLQRRESGSVVSLGGVAYQGRLLAACVSRYARFWPPRGGSASASVTIAPPDGLLDQTTALIEAVEWQGIFELEFVETADGLATIDFNPRPYGSMTLSVASGANLPAAFVDALLGRVPDTCLISRPGVRYRWEESEALNVVDRVRRGRIGEAARIVQPHRETTHAFLQAWDPAPVVARALTVARSRLAKR